jgi:hypothetical protein
MMNKRPQRHEIGAEEVQGSKRALWETLLWPRRGRRISEELGPRRTAVASQWCMGMVYGVEQSRAQE